MAIFSRRTIQRLINENAEFLTKTQTRKHIDLLNFNKKIYQEWLQSGKHINDLIEVYINTEWEIVLLNSLSKLGNVIHEKKVGASEPDIFFTSFKHNFEFLGDITCITGKQDQHNISLAFKNEFKEIIDMENPNGYWKIFVNGNSREMDFCRAKPRLMLGGKNERKEIFNSKEFVAFIQGVKRNPEIKHSFTYTKNKENPKSLPDNQIEMYENVIVDIEIRYEPRTFYQIEYSQFDDRKIVNIEANEIYNSLSKKYDQLIKTNYNDCLGVFLCDGIGDTFNRRDLLHKNTREVIGNFLYNHRKIDFVLTVSFEAESYNFFKEKRKIEIALFKGYGNKLNSEVVRFLENDLVKSFPKPVRTVSEARFSLKYNFEDKNIVNSSVYCGLEASENTIKVSAKMILEMLSGKLSLEKFFYQVGFEGQSSIPNQFLRMLNSGKLFSQVEIENRDDEFDDDLLVFKFDKQDVAISPFKMPNIDK